MPDRNPADWGTLAAASWERRPASTKLVEYVSTGGAMIDAAASSSHDDGMRTIIDLPETQIKALDSYRKREGISRAEAVRRAIEAFVPSRGKGSTDFASHPAFGSSKRYKKEGSVKTVRRLREEWR